MPRLARCNTDKIDAEVNDRLSEYKKAGIVRNGLRRRVFAEIYQMLKIVKP
jgi:hypothetical protein